MSAYSIEQGEVVAVLRDFRDNSFDALMCDPPYGFSFMGKSWDYDVPSVELWQECRRVLKPGAPLVAFGGSRTYHRLACGIEDAGFELRDCLMWLYGKGFPKSLNISKALDKRRDDTAEVRVVCRFLRAAMQARGLTSAWLGEAFGMHSRMIDHWAAYDTDSQPTLPTWDQWLRLKELLQLGPELDAEVWRLNGRKGTLGEAWQNAEVIGHGVGIDTSQSSLAFAGAAYGGTSASGTYEIKAPATELAKLWVGYGTALKPAWEPIVLARKPVKRTLTTNVTKYGVGGLALEACEVVSADGIERWPANLLLDEEAAALLDAEGPYTKSVPYRENTAAGAVLPLSKRTAGGYADAGGPSRFFYCSKVSTSEREAGCEGLPKRSAGEVTEREDGSAGLENPRAGAGRTGGARNHHPTLKPISLTTWLARLILPPSTGGAGPVLLVPFAGAGSEMIGALKAGWGCVFGIEREWDYVGIARARLAHWCPESEAA